MRDRDRAILGEFLQEKLDYSESIQDNVDTLLWVMGVYLRQLERRYGKGNNLPREIHEKYALANAVVKHAEAARKELERAEELLECLSGDVMEISHSCLVEKGHE